VDHDICAGSGVLSAVGHDITGSHHGACLDHDGLAGLHGLVGRATAGVAGWLERH
jgi:hypothetical protein